MPMYPCRLCPHVVDVEGLDRLDHLWGYAVESLIRNTWQAQSEIPDYAGHGGLRRDTVDLVPQATEGAGGVFNQ